MIRFSLHMALRTGREAVVRLMVTAAAVAIGVTLLLSVLAAYEGYQSMASRSCWECTQQQDGIQPTLLWNYGEDEYRGSTIERLDVATLAADAPSIPGLSAMPSAGQYYASPALATLLRSVPADELGDRFPGTLAGTIGPAALTGPDELVIVVGHTRDDMTAAYPGADDVATINSAPRGLSTSQFYKFGFGMGTVALLIPMMILIGTATRMAAARREERYAAMRLVGATRRQIDAVASVDAVAGSLAGALLGIGAFALLQPALANLKLTGARYFAADVVPPGWAYPAVTVGVPLLATAGCLLSLRRVRVSPLGVSRRVTPPPPRSWRVLPLVAGVLLFTVPVLRSGGNKPDSLLPSMGALALTMVGVMVAGPWLTMQANRLVSRFTPGPAGLLAGRRMADNPRAAFRSVSGLVLALLVGTALAGLASAALASQNTSVDSALSNVIRADLTAGGPKTGCPACVPGPRGSTGGSASSDQLLSTLATYPGVTVLPMWAMPDSHGPDVAIDCAQLRAFPELGQCAPGATTVEAGVGPLFTDNLRAMNDQLPLVTADNPPVSAGVTGLRLGVLLVGTHDAATRERVRTLLSSYSTGGRDAPMTFGEVGAARGALVQEAERAVELIAGITLLIAGCSLAVAVSGGLVERKRPFTLLRLTGTPVRTLYRVVLLETVFPLFAAAILASGVGLILAWPIARILAPQSRLAAVPGASYYALAGGGLALALVVVLSCLPLLRRITHPDTVRFE